MANNPYVNKVVFGNTTVIDISDSTAVAADVLAGKYFYLPTGQRVAGTSSGGGVDGDELAYGGAAIVGSAIVGTAVAG